jgi:hypothetical protein
MWDRRNLLASATALLGAELVAPLASALAAEAAAPGFGASHAVFTPDQRSLLAAISERIIPTTDTPGAIAAGVPQFIEMMVADFYETADRNDFLNGIGLIEGHAQIHYARSFTALAEADQDAVLTLAMRNQIAGAGGFFNHCRQLVILGYYTSEIGCKQERVYVPVPGRYDGQYPYAQVRRVFSS